MPIISQFYGIIVSMYFNENNKHIKQTKLIEAWIIIHKEELITLWKLMEEEGRIFKIKPL